MKGENKNEFISRRKDENGNVDLSNLDFSDFDGNVDISDMEVARDLYQGYQHVIGDLWQENQTVVVGNLYQGNQLVRGNLFQSYQDVLEGSLFQDNQKVRTLKENEEK